MHFYPSADAVSCLQILCIACTIHFCTAYQIIFPDDDDALNSDGTLFEITQNVAFNIASEASYVYFFYFGIFCQFCPITIDLSGNIV